MSETELAKKAFLKGIAFKTAFDGANQHNTFYARGDYNKEQRGCFEAFLYEKLERQFISIINRKDYEDADHYASIKSFADQISSSYMHSAFFPNNDMTIGCSQKLVNLYWKMNWLLFPDVTMPIQCPFDANIISKLDENVRGIHWKNCNIREYEQLVISAKKIAEEEGLNLAEWELKINEETNNVRKNNIQKMELGDRVMVRFGN